MTTIEDSLKELEHCAALGLKGVVLSAFPNGMAYPLPEDDRFWAAALDMQMPRPCMWPSTALVSVLNSPPLSTRQKIRRSYARCGAVSWTKWPSWGCQPRRRLAR